MCGRYYIEIDDEDLLDIVATIEKNLYKVGEIAPTDLAPVLTQTGARAIKWGFPQWQGSGVIINARAETAAEKRMFSSSLKQRRCVIPASGYYEWKATSKSSRKEKYYFRNPASNSLFMAGFYNSFSDDNGEYNAFVILTTEPSSSVTTIHDRMPVILSRNEIDNWLGDMAFAYDVLGRAGPKMLSEAV